MTKADLSLWTVLTERERLLADAQARGDDAALKHAERPIHVEVHFHGDLAPLIAAGFPLQRGYQGGASGQLSPSQIRALEARDEVHLISLPQPAPLTLDRSVPEIHGVDAWGIGIGATDVARGKGHGVVVGIIDSGIDVFHGAFRNPDGSTRILALWDQTFNYNAAGQPVDVLGNLLTGALKPTDETGADATAARAPVAIDPALNYGIHFTRQQIDAALAAHPNGKDLPISLRDQPVSSGDETIHHGTHVAGIAAGNGAQNDKCTKPFTYIGVAPQADLVIVKTAVGGGQPNGRTDPPHAVRFIFGVAASPDPPQFPQGRPAVVNYSIGGHFGPHNGHSPVALEFDRLTTGPQAVGHAIVVSAGNDRNVDLHAAFTIAAGAPQTVRVNLMSKTSPHLTLWGTVNPAAALSCVVRAPSTGAVQQTAAQSVNAVSAVLPLGSHSVQVRPFLTPLGDPDRHFIVDIIGQGGGNVTAGMWEFDFIAGPTPAAAANLHLWVASPGGWDVAIQPFGAATSAQDVARGLKRPADWIAATLTVPAACRRAISVAAYDAETTGAPLASFSARLEPGLVRGGQCHRQAGHRRAGHGDRFRARGGAEMLSAVRVLRRSVRRRTGHEPGGAAHCWRRRLDVCAESAADARSDQDAPDDQRAHASGVARWLAAGRRTLGRGPGGCPRRGAGRDPRVDAGGRDRDAAANRAGARAGAGSRAGELAGSCARLEPAARSASGVAPVRRARQPALRRSEAPDRHQPPRRRALAPSRRPRPRARHRLR
jgi:hypothetical protein